MDTAITERVFRCVSGNTARCRLTLFRNQYVEKVRSQKIDNPTSIFMVIQLCVPSKGRLFSASLACIVYRARKQKGKAVPLQAWTDPEGTRRLRLPDFKTIGT
jgi:hypothetical protein